MATDRPTIRPRFPYRRGGPAPGAAVHKVLNGDAGTEVQSPHALWRVDLVSAEGEHVDVLFLHVDVHVAHGLHRVGVEQHAVLFADGADLRNGLMVPISLLAYMMVTRRVLSGDGGLQLIRGRTIPFSCTGR